MYKRQLQNGEQEEQNEHLGNEAQNRADTGDNAVHNQAVQPVSNAQTLQEAAQRVRDNLTKENVIRPAGGKGANANRCV